MRNRNRCGGGVGVRRLFLARASVRRTALAVIDRYDRCKFAVRDLQRTIGRSELYAVAHGEDSLFGTKNFDARWTLWVVLDCSTIFGADGDSVVLAVDGFD